MAVKACVLFLQDIREEVGDEAFGAFMNIDAKETRFTVAYVIDTAASMIEELPLIQASLPRIREQLDDYKASSEGGAVNYMLVPFNDSGKATM